MTDLPHVQPYGLWKSSITSELIASDGVRKFNFVDIDNNFNIYFDEIKSKENGRTAIFKIRPDGFTKEVIPDKFGVRTLVHEYGGKSFFFERP